MQVRPLNEHLVGSVRAWMVLLLCAVGLVVTYAWAPETTQRSLTETSVVAA